MRALGYLAWDDAQRRFPLLGRSGAGKRLELCCRHRLAFVEYLAGGGVEQPIHVVAHDLQGDVVRGDRQWSPLRIAVVDVNGCKHFVHLTLSPGPRGTRRWLGCCGNLRWGWHRRWG